MAVPVQGQPAGYLTELQLDGTGPQARLSGYPAKNADVKIRVKTAGPVAADDLEADAAEIEIKRRQGMGRSREGAAPGNVIGDTGATLLFSEGRHSCGRGRLFVFQHACLSGRWKEPATARARSLKLRESGQGVLAAAELVIRITKGGGRNEGSFSFPLTAATITRRPGQFR